MVFGRPNLERLNSQEIEQEAKITLCYAISCGIWSTQTFLLGSETRQLSSSFTGSDWQAILDPLLPEKGLEKKAIVVLKTNGVDPLIQQGLLVQIDLWH